MSLKSFRSVGWVAGVAATALGCYMVNLKVASERAELEEVETRIVLAQRDIRLLQTEIGTRGRLAQLEQWNVKVLALSAPKANQFLEGSFQLATLTRPDKVVDPEAPMVLASAPAPPPRPMVDDGASALPPSQPGVAQRPRSTSPGDLLHVASLKEEVVARPAEQKIVEKPHARRKTTATGPGETAKAAKDAETKTAKPTKSGKPSASVTTATSKAKATATTVTTAKAPTVKAAASKTSPAKAAAKSPPKEAASQR